MFIFVSSGNIQLAYKIIHNSVLGWVEAQTIGTGPQRLPSTKQKPQKHLAAHLALQLHGHTIQTPPQEEHASLTLLKRKALELLYFSFKKPSEGIRKQTNKITKQVTMLILINFLNFF